MPSCCRSFLEEEAVVCRCFPMRCWQMIRFYGGAMGASSVACSSQNYVPSWTWKKMTEQGGAMLGAAGGDPSKVGSEVWQQFSMQMRWRLRCRAMGNYLEQSSNHVPSTCNKACRKAQSSSSQVFSSPGFPGGEKGKARRCAGTKDCASRGTKDE